MKYTPKDIEDTLIDVFARVKKHNPKLEKISFELSKYKHLEYPKLWGFYHIDEGCQEWQDLTEIFDLMEKPKELL